jgi:hypothetical protein
MRSGLRRPTRVYYKQLLAIADLQHELGQVFNPFILFTAPAM